MAKDNAGVIAPPPLIYLGFLLAGLVLDWVLSVPGFGLAPEWRWVIVAAFGVAGIVLVAWALGRFRIAKTPAPPWQPTTAIVTSGIYAFSRNPMYLAMALLYASLAFAFDSVIALIALALALAVIEFGVIRREERYLEAKFGDEYLRYKAAVRRWI